MKNRSFSAILLAVATPLLATGDLPILPAPHANAQQVISTDAIVTALGDSKCGGEMTTVEIEAQKDVKAALTDAAKIVTIDSSAKVKIEKTAQKDCVSFIDFDVYFDFDSAAITDKAKATLDPLVKALDNPRLKGDTFVVAGYTDATGKPDYNKDLSQQRATAVKDYVANGSKLPKQLFIDVGFGETHLKDEQNPTSAVNRRVQIINVGK